MSREDKGGSASSLFIGKALGNKISAEIVSEDECTWREYGKALNVVANNFLIVSLSKECIVFKNKVRSIIRKR